MNTNERLQRLEVAFGAQSALVRDLRDAVTVTAELEATHSRFMKEHTLWLAEHERAINEHRRQMKEHDERMAHLDERIDHLVSGFGEYIRRSDRPQ